MTLLDRIDERCCIAEVDVAFAYVFLCIIRIIYTREQMTNQLGIHHLPRVGQVAMARTRAPSFLRHPHAGTAKGKSIDQKLVIVMQACLDWLVVELFIVFPFNIEC